MKYNFDEFVVTPNTAWAYLEGAPETTTANDVRNAVAKSYNEFQPKVLSWDMLKFYGNSVQAKFNPPAKQFANNDDYIYALYTFLREFDLVTKATVVETK